MSSSQKSTNNSARSPLFYVGDKYKLIPQLQAIFPADITRFIEPFTGGGSVPLNIIAEQYLLNDIDANIVRIHKLLEASASEPEVFFADINTRIKKYGLSESYLQDIIPAALKVEWKKTYYARFNNEAYKQLRADFNNNQKDTLQLYLLLIYGFNRMIRFNGRGDFNVPVGNVDFNKNVKSSLDSYFAWSQQHTISWSNTDYSDFINDIVFHEGDFVYLDPPYLITFSEYNKLWNDDHEQRMLALLDLLNDKGVTFAISNVTHYKGRTNTIFIEWAKKYTVHEIKSNYISYHDNSIKSFKEVVVTNY